MVAQNPPFPTQLRLVYPPDDSRDEAAAVAPRPARVKAAAKRVARENHSASTLDPLDAHRILAMRVAELLEGGRAAVLTHERRERLRRLSTILGVREFDANLIIAGVQDRARRGEIRLASAPSAPVPVPTHAAPTPEPAPAASRPLAPTPLHNEPRVPAGVVVMGQIAAACAIAAFLLGALLLWLE